MSKSYKSIFDRLTDRQNALFPKEHETAIHRYSERLRDKRLVLLASLSRDHSVYLPYSQPLTPSQPHTLRKFSDELSLPVELLITQFRNAGIPDLTPEHLLTERHKNALLQYLRNAHRNREVEEVKCLYKNEKILPEQQLVLEEVNDELIFALAARPDLIYELGHRQFEELVAKLFSDRGYEVSLTKRTRDGGYDLMAVVNNSISSFVVLAECKKYSPNNKVGVEVVRGLFGVTEAQRANQGLIITSSFFSRDAHLEQIRIGNRIGLKDYNDLVDWLKPYSNTR